MTYQGAIYALMFVFACVGYSVLPIRNKLMVLIVWFTVLSVLLIIALIVFGPNRTVKFSTWELAAITVPYSAALYAGLCDAFRFGFARYLTRRRGYKWVKELDYPYLILGSIGVLASLNRLEVARDHLSRIDLLGPMLVVTAIVIRLIKTRADIEDWALR